MVNKRNKIKGGIITLSLIVLLALAMFFSLFLGSVFVSPGDLWGSEILWQIRLPRVILAALVGLMLSVS